jgi:hypothetical protein
VYQTDLNNIRDFILENNPYLNEGFADVYQDETTGYIHASNKVVFPADERGDYFYLRLPKAVGFNYNNQYDITDCQKGFALRTPVILVACMRDADNSKLQENLLVTLSNYKVVNLRFTGAIFNKIDVALQELSKIKVENQVAALENIDLNYTMVSIHFEVEMQYMPKKLNCITNPCKEC